MPRARVTTARVGRMRREGRAFSAALAFLTRLPMGPRAHEAGDLAFATPYFPLVGLVVGLAGTAVYAAAALVWPVPLAIIAAVGATVLLTGAFHEDALADACDGFGGGWDRAQILAIMKDSRVGSYAVVGLVLVIGAKVAALVAVATQGIGGGWSGTGVGAIAVARALVAGHVLGRWSSVPLMRWCPYARAPDPGGRPSAGQPFAGGVSAARLGAATAGAAIISVVALGRMAVPVLAVACALTWLARRYCMRRLGGVTGDVLGATNQLVELAVYLVLASQLRR